MAKTVKKSIQELILDFLYGKRAARCDDVAQYVEDILAQEIDERKVKPRYLVNRAIKNMVDGDILEQHDTEQSSFVSLSSLGRHKLRNIKLSSKNHLVSTAWDGYWRMVILDFPDEGKSERDALRYILKKAQFVQLKNSIWISPFPLEHMLIAMKRDLKLQNEIMIIVTDKLDSETEGFFVEQFQNNSEN